MMVTYNLSFVFKGLRREKIRYFHMVLYFSIKVNSKLNVGVQSVTRILILGCKTCIPKVEGAKCNQEYSLGW